MRRPPTITSRLTDADLEFVVRLAAPEARDKGPLKQLIVENEEFRKALVGGDAVFQSMIDSEEAFLKISPGLYFEVLLRRAFKDLETATYTMERSGNQSIPVFDTGEVVKLLGMPKVQQYLADMLASFTRIESYVRLVRVRRGIWRKVRYNDMDLDSLLRFCADADEQHRLRFYKRIADVCLFITGMFRDHASLDARHPSSGRPRPHATGRMRRSLEDYESEGRRFYGLAAEHPTARALELSEVFGLLREHFTSARKPLSLIASQYLHSRRHRLFGAPAE